MGDERNPPSAEARDVYVFFALACAITWALDLPLALASLRGVEPPPYAMPLVGLGALGPTIAAFALARRRGALRDVFGRWRTNPLWILVGLLAPMALHLPATAIEVALGGHPSRWFHLPDRPEYVAALVMFSVGEEFGWRGFAHRRVTELHGPVAGSLILGVVWGLWHTGMMIGSASAGQGLPSGASFVVGISELALWAVVFAWVFERSNRSMAVALALHAGAHLDNVNRAPEFEVRLRVFRFVIVAIAAALAARDLSSRRSGRS